MPADAAFRNERRRHRRDQTSLIATVNYGSVLLPCFVADVSMGGAKIKLIEPGKLPRGAAVLECSRFGKIAAELVWQRGLFAGFKFGDAAAVGDLAQHLAQPAPPAGAPVPRSETPPFRVAAPPSASA